MNVPPPVDLAALHQQVTRLLTETLSAALALSRAVVELDRLRNAPRWADAGLTAFAERDGLSRYWETAEKVEATLRDVEATLDRLRKVGIPGAPAG